MCGITSLSRMTLRSAFRWDDTTLMMILDWFFCLMQNFVAGYLQNQYIKPAQIIIDLFLVLLHQLILCYCTHKDVFWDQNLLFAKWVVVALHRSAGGKRICFFSERYFYCDICLGICEGTIENHTSEFEEVKGLIVQRIQPLSQRSQHGSLKCFQLFFLPKQQPHHFSQNVGQIINN